MNNTNNNNYGNPFTSRLTHEDKKLALLLFFDLSDFRALEVRDLIDGVRTFQKLDKEVGMPSFLTHVHDSAHKLWSHERQRLLVTGSNDARSSITPPNHHHQKKVLIATTWKSGSTFLSNTLASLPG